MNLLVLTPLVPYPPHDGDKLRLYHLLRHLKKRGHQIDLFCLTRVKSDFQHAAQLRPLCRNLYLEHLTMIDLFFNLLGGVLMGQSMNVSSYFSPKLRDSLAAYWATEAGKSIDVVLAHRLRMAPAAFEKNPGKPVVLDMTDSLTAYTQQLKEQPGVRFSRWFVAWWDYWFLKREELEYGQKAFQSLVISGPDSWALSQLGLRPEKVAVIPNGVEVPGASSPRPEIYPAKAPVICFVGNMGYPPNEDGALWFLEKIWPRVKQAIPQAIFAAVGGAAREPLLKFHNGVDVFVTGWVPAIEPYVKHASLTIAPLRVAAGMQNKVALSLSWGVPVVATPAALSWLVPEGRSGVIMAEKEEAFTLAVVETLSQSRRAKAAALKGKRFILKNYRWAESGKKLESVLKAAAKKKG